MVLGGLGSIYSSTQGPGADSVTLEEVVIDKVVSSLRTVISLRELSIKFTISQRQVEYSRARGERVYSISID
jgi:hypothetical protein